MDGRLYTLPLSWVYQIWFRNYYLAVRPNLYRTRMEIFHMM